jgi:hypothetical protein
MTGPARPAVVSGGGGLFVPPRRREALSDYVKDHAVSPIGRCSGIESFRIEYHSVAVRFGGEFSCLIYIEKLQNGFRGIGHRPAPIEAYSRK